MSDYVIPFAEAAAIACIRTEKPNPDYNTITLTVVGLLGSEVVPIEIPRVVNPVAATDAHWTTLYQEGSAVVLSATNNSVTIPVSIPIRLKKPLSTGNAFGIRRS